MEKRISFSKYFVDGVYPYLWIMLAAVVLYFKTTAFGFTYFDDDHLVVSNNPYLRDLANIGSTFFRSVYLDAVSAYYRPLLTISFMINAHWAGIAPLGYHATNIGIHALACALFFRFLCELEFHKPTSLYLGLLFAVHPLLVQAVAWVPGRNDSLLGLFVLASFLSAAGFLKRGDAFRYITHMIFFTAALLIKENAVALIPTLLFYSYCVQKNSIKDRKTVLLILGWTGIVSIWLFVRSHFVQQLDIPSFTLQWNAQIIGESFLAIIIYIGQSIFPLHTSLYPHVTAVGIIYGYAALLLMCAGIVYSFRPRKTVLVLGLTWFLAFLIPTFIMKNNYYFEHRMYVPLMGLLAVLGEAGKCLSAQGRANRAVRVIAGAMLLVVFGLISYRRSDIFAGRATYWSKDIEQFPCSAYAKVKRARAFIDYHLPSLAEIELRKALRLQPSSGDAHYLLGDICYAKNELLAAKKEYRLAQSFGQTDYHLFVKIAQIYEQQNAPDKALVELKKGLAAVPFAISIYEEFIRCYIQLGEYNKARFYVRHYRTVAGPGAYTSLKERNPDIARLHLE